MLGLSAIVIARNEEANIAACLASISFADEIVVVDGASTDRTAAIAQAAGARVIRTDDWPGFGAQKNRALSHATQPWVLSIDADERITPQLKEEIERAIAGDTSQCDAWDMPRKSSFCGQFIAHSGWYPDRVTRLFRRARGRFSDDFVHEKVLVDGRTGHLRSDLLHTTYPDLETMLQKLDRYSSASATALYAAGARSSLGGALIRGLWAFVRTYLLRAGFLDGRMGLALAISIAETTYYKYLKLWLLEKRSGRSV